MAETAESTNPQAHNASLAMRLLEHQNRYLESQLDLWDRLVDFDDELLDNGQRVWNKIHLGTLDPGAAALAYRSDVELGEIRNQGRWLALNNEFAINALENRISYAVGEGHVYQVVPKAGEEVDADVLDAVNAVLGEFLESSRWHARQQEMRLRLDRDGECFLRLFPDPAAGLAVRFIEPEQVRTPARLAGDKQVRYGVRHQPGDVETVLAYYVDDEDVPAGDVQHRKANVDLTAPRGIPVFHAVRKNLARAAKILRNMSTVAEIQAAIAMVREHVQGSSATVEQYVSNMADVKMSDRTTGQTRNYKQYPPGTVIDHGPGTKYTFPAQGIDVARYVQALQAELRAIASRLVMPEFMLSSDASNANYSSTMVAEGPAVKMFERLQADTIAADLVVIKRAIRAAADAGRLPADVLERVDVDADGPRVQTRDRLKDAQADQILYGHGVMSPQTFAARHGLDYGMEREQLDAEQERETGFAGDLGREPDDETGSSGSSSGM